MGRTFTKYLNKPTMQTTTFTIYRGKTTSKVRITARAGHDYWQQCREKLEKRYGQLESFSPTSRTARLPE
jgi:hypothetical protein